jgi:hypothetical protein
MCPIRQLQPVRRRPEVERYEQPLRIVSALVSKYLAFPTQQYEITGRQRQAIPPELNEPTVKFQDRLRIFRHARHVARRPVGIERQPRLDRGETGIFTLIPWHRRAHGVAAQRQTGLAQLARVSDLGWFDPDITQTEFVAIVERGCTAELSNRTAATRA